MKHEQVLIRLPAHLIRRIDVYWHREMLKSRTEAIRDLISQALDEAGIGEPVLSEPAPAKRRTLR
jgi:metal-responsive CopG/Arc/MetJ family transcriptional regulator